MRRAVLLLAAGALLSAGAVQAEVSVNLNVAGHVTGLNLTSDLERGILWGRTGELPEAQLLNPDGDPLGDRMPSCGILALPTEDAMSDLPTTRGRIFSPGATGSATKRRTPIAVWPRFDGNDWEIVYSVWDYRMAAWRPISRVEAADNQTDDYDPQVYVRGRRVILVWRRDLPSETFAITNAVLVPFGDSYELIWEAPVDMQVPPQIQFPEDFYEAPLPVILGTGVGHTPTVDPRSSSSE